MPISATAIPASQNEDWGFFGTIRHHAEPRAAWALALQIVADATGCSLDEVRAFLDSRHGRHFADEVSARITEDAGQNEAAIRAATASWMAYRITRHNSKITGIPMGFSYLAGYVIAAAIADDAAQAESAP